MRSTLAVALALTALGGCSGQPGPEPSPAVGRAAPAHPAGACSSAAPDQVLRFADERLERAVRDALRLAAEAPLTCALAASLTILHAPDAGIHDLEGIVALRGLEELSIYGNNSVADIAPLVGLPALRDLNLARTRVTDIAPLAELETLTSLSLYGNPITDIGPLAALTRLTRLRVEHSAGVSDLSPIGGLAGLTRLEIGGNAIRDIGPLVHLSGLTRLSLQDNADLTDLEPLRHLARLEILSLGGTSVSDLSPLAGLSHLHTVGLEGTPVTDLGALIGLTELTRIDLRGTRHLTDIQPLLFNTGLGRGDAVRLERSGVSCEDVTALRRKGVTVLASCP